VPGELVVSPGHVSPGHAGVRTVVEAAEEQWGVGDVLEGFGPVIQVGLEVLQGDPVTGHGRERQDVLAHQVEIVPGAPQLVAFGGQDRIGYGPFRMRVF
jgi:hypothetical protein